jgi:NADH:ubiquinone oxidoreductase subunit 6 (subunit J)
MKIVEILFYFFIALAAGSALAILFSKNVFKSALSLLVTLLSVAGLYVLAYAEFIAVTQILVYAGGVLVVILFGIMLTSKLSGQALVVEHKHIFSGTVAAVGFFALLAGNTVTPNANNLIPENIRDIGVAIFSEYTLPFEIAGILLLASLVGAAVVSSQLKSKTG